MSVSVDRGMQLKLIDSVFISFEKDEEPEGLDLLDADVVKVNALLEKNEK